MELSSGCVECDVITALIINGAQAYVFLCFKVIQSSFITW